MKAVLKLLPGVIWLGITLYLFTLPGSALPQESWMDALHADKIVHFSLFFVLVTTWSWGIVSTKPGIELKQTVLITAFVALFYGIAIEFIQKYWIPNRSFDVWDIVADGAGSFFPLLFVRQISRQLAVVRSGKNMR